MVLIIAGGAYYLGTQTLTNKQPAGILSPTPKVSPTNQLVGADEDEFGCKVSAGYSWCAAKNKCLRVWEEPCADTQSDISENIKQALIKKNNWATNINLEVTINKREGIYVSGGVREKDTMAGGGYFFAVQDGGEWVIVADGNGIISCASVDQYPEYPISFIPECWDESTQELIHR